MTRLRVEPFEDMGEPAILLNTDRAGIRVFEAAVRQALEAGEAHFEQDGVTHEIVRAGDAADIELGPRRVVWHFDDACLRELLDLMSPMVVSDRPGHQYFDNLKSPVDLLVLSHDEYTRPLSYGVFTELYPEQTPTGQ